MALQIDVRYVYGWRWYVRDESGRAHSMGCPSFRTKKEAKEHSLSCEIPGAKAITPTYVTHLATSLERSKLDVCVLVRALHDAMNGKNKEQTQEVYDRIRQYYKIHVNGK